MDELAAKVLRGSSERLERSNVDNVVPTNGVEFHLPLDVFAGLVKFN